MLPSRFLLSVAVICLGSSLRADPVGFTNFQVLNPFSPARTLYAKINDRGDIAGTLLSSSLNQFGFLLPNGSVSPSIIMYPGGSYTEVQGLNNSDELVGLSFTGSKLQEFTDLNGVSSPVNANATYTLPNAINNKGDVAGAYSNLASSGTGFSIVNGQLSTFNVPGAPLSTYATGINDSDQIVGYFVGVTTGRAFDGFLRMPNGDITTFGVSASLVYQVPADINNAGMIVGSYGDFATDTSHGFARLGDTTYTFDAPGARDTYLTGINNLNEIVGVTNDFNGGNRVFTVDFTPAPEPSSLYLFALGCLGWGLLRQRAKIRVAFGLL